MIFTSAALLVIVVAVQASYVTVASSTPTAVGGGHISGHIYGFDMYDQLRPIEWAQVSAAGSPYAQPFTTTSNHNGFYEMFLPAGEFNLTVSSPGYLSKSMMITVPNGSSQSLTFTLEQSKVPIPEFPSYAAPIALLLAMAGLAILKRRSRAQ